MKTEEFIASQPPELVARVKAKLADKVWRRTCQDCGNVQADTEPVQAFTTAYEVRKCKKCKSESLDYGSYFQRYQFLPDEQEFMNKFYDCEDYYG